MYDYYLTIVLAPLVAAIVAGLFGHRIGLVQFPLPYRVRLVNHVVPTATRSPKREERTASHMLPRASVQIRGAERLPAPGRCSTTVGSRWPSGAGFFARAPGTSLLPIGWLVMAPLPAPSSRAKRKV